MGKRRGSLRILGVVALLTTSLVGLSFTKNASGYGSEEFGGGSLGSSTCEGGGTYCYNGAIWTYYSFDDSASGTVKVGTNYTPWDWSEEFHEPDGTIASGTEVNVDACKERNAPGVWVLQHVTSIVNGTEWKGAFGSVPIAYSEESGGSAPTIRAEDVDGLYVDDIPGNPGTGTNGVPNGLHFELFEDDWGKIKELYNTYQSHGGNWDTKMKDSNYAAFCGDPYLNNPEKEKAEAVFVGKIKLDPNVAFTCTEASGSSFVRKQIECKGTGNGPIGSASDPVITGIAFIKNKSMNPDVLNGVAKTRYDFPDPGTPLALNENSLEIGPFERQNAEKNSAKTYAGVIPVDTVKRKVCFNLAYYSQAVYEKPANGDWERTELTSPRRASACATFTNYGSRTASFEGKTDGSWNNHENNPRLIFPNLGDKTQGYIESEMNENGKVYSTFTNPPIELNADGSLPDAAKNARATYGYTFTHEISLNDADGLKSFLEKYTRGQQTAEIDYEIQESVDGSPFQTVVSNGRALSGTMNFGDKNGMNSSLGVPGAAPLVKEITVQGSDTAGRVICQRVHFTKELSYVTSNDGLVRTKSDTEGYSKQVCLTLGMPVSHDDYEDLPDSFVKVVGDTKVDGIDFSDGGFNGGGVWKTLDVVMTGKFNHEMWVDGSELSYREEAQDGLPFVRQGNPGSVTNYKFGSDYVGLGRYRDGSAEKYLSPSQAGGNNLHNVLGLGLDFQITDLREAAIKFTVAGNRNGSVTDTSSGKWVSHVDDGSTSMVIGFGTADAIDLGAGEEKELDILTVNKPWKWSVAYAKATRVTDIQGLSLPQQSKPYKIVLKEDGIQVTDDGRKDKVSENVTGVKVHRDYNFKVQNFILSNPTGPQAFGGASATVVAGEKAEIGFQFDVVSRGDGSVWGDGNERKYLTDVFQNNTKAYLVKFEVAPGADSALMSEMINNGYSDYSGSLGYNAGSVIDWFRIKLGGSLVDSSFRVEEMVGGGDNDPFTVAASGGEQVNIRGNKVYYPATKHEGLSYTARNVQVNEDAAVGSKFCVGMFISNPVNNDTGLDQDNGSSLLSQIACANVVKKPSMEVWGGDVVGMGGIQTSTTRTDASGREGAYGSWGDFGIIANKDIKGMSSGRKIVTEGRGDSQVNMGRVSPITIANQNNDYGKANIDGADNSILNSLVNRYNSGNTEVSVADARGDDTLIIDDVNSLCAELDSKPCVILGKNVRINNNIKLTDRSYSNRQRVVQILIVADGAVTIEDDVFRVDAWIIAKGKVDTCYIDGEGFNRGIGGFDGLNSDQAIGATNCQKQLSINGPMIGSKMAFDRTYGEDVNGKYYDENNVLHDMGSYTLGVSGEVIDFNPGAILFGAQESSGNAPRTTYIRKLAPRY